MRGAFAVLVKELVAFRRMGWQAAVAVVAGVGAALVAIAAV